MEMPVNQTMVSAELPRVPETVEAPNRVGSRPAPDFERFRLRRFVEDLVQMGECVVHDEPIALAHIAGVLDGNPKAVWFRNVGPEGAELVGNVMGSRRRLSCALNVCEVGFADELRRRLTEPFEPIEVTSTEAPVHQKVLTGAKADLTRLPVHLQHGFDGAPYISASIDFARNPQTGGTNLGCRRMMLRSPRTAGIDLNAPSDLRALYQTAAAQGQRLPVAFTVGSHPTDFIAAVSASAAADELTVVGAIRASHVPVVKCITIDTFVPADAEYVLEGYLDPCGLTEPEGPYGEYIGYYGVLKNNPVFHLTAIAQRRDALFQTVTIGGRSIGRTDTAQLVAAKTEATVWEILRHAVREPVAVCCTTSCGGMYNVRVSIRQRYPGESRNAIAAVFASVADVKHVFVTDDDIDVFNDEQIDWALATRFQADRDFVSGSDFRAVPVDPSLGGARTGGKAGFDCTKPFGKGDSLEFTVPEPPRFKWSGSDSVEAILKAGPATFLQIMERSGSEDGREILRTFEKLYESGGLIRTPDGRYALEGEGAS